MLCRNVFTLLRSSSPWAVLVATSLALASASPARADLVFGDFEGTGVPTGWGDWASGFDPGTGQVYFDTFTAIPHSGLENNANGQAVYSYSPNFATSGSQSIKLDGRTSYDTSLAYNAGSAGTIADFLANDTLSFDITFIGASTGTYNNIYGIAINTNTGYHNLSGNEDSAFVFANPDLSTDHSTTITYDYSGVPLNDLANTSYFQVIIATNNNVDASEVTYYFDNFQLSSSAVPEPSSFAMLTLVGLVGGIVKRRRHA